MGNEPLTRAGKKAAEDDSVKAVTLDHAKEQGVPTADQAAKPMTNEQMEQQKKAEDAGVSGESTGSDPESGSEGSPGQDTIKPKLTIQAYKGDPSKAAEQQTDENHTDEQHPDEQQQTANQQPGTPQADTQVAPQPVAQQQAPVIQQQAANKKNPPQLKRASSSPAILAANTRVQQPASQPTTPAPQPPQQDQLPPQPTVPAPQPLQQTQLPPQPTTPAPQPPQQAQLPPQPQQPAPQPPPGAPTLTTAEILGTRGPLDTNSDDNISMGTVDTIKNGIDMVSSTAGLAGTLTGIGGSEMYGGNSDSAKRADSAATGLSLASDSLSLVNSGISLVQDVKGFTENDKFTTTGTKWKQGAGFIGDLAGAAGTATNMAGTIVGMGGSENDTDEQKAALNRKTGKLGIASNSLGLLSNGIGLGVEASNVSGNRSDIAALNTEMARAGTSEEFKRYARIAQGTKEIQNTQSGFNIAKSAAGFIGSATGLASSIGKAAGVKDDSTTGKWLKGVGLAGSLISSLTGTVATFWGSKKVRDLKSKRNEKGIDEYLNTPELQSKIQTKGHNLSIDETRNVAKKQLGFDSSDKMFSAILTQYATTIRDKALNGAERDQYKVLIQSLGFKLGEVKNDADLPSVEAISQKLAGG